MQVKTENFQAQIVFRWQDFTKTQLILLHLVIQLVLDVQDLQLIVQIAQHQCIWMDWMFVYFVHHRIISNVLHVTHHNVSLVT